MQLNASTSNWSFRNPPSIKCFKFLSQKLTSVSGEESDCTGADTVDANSELQRYTAELHFRHRVPYSSGWIASPATRDCLSWHWISWHRLPLESVYVERLLSLCGDLIARKRNRTRVSRLFSDTEPSHSALNSMYRELHVTSF